MSTQEIHSAQSLPEFIAITGRKGSGKDYLGHYLESEYGYLHIPASDILRQTARERGYKDPIPREVLSKIGDEFKKKFGPSPITEGSVAKYKQKQDQYSGLVISGLRRPPEIKAFKNRGALVLWIHASESQRFDNVHDRDQNSETLEEFLANDRLEYEGPAEAEENSINLKAIEDLADYKVINDNTSRFLSDSLSLIRPWKK